MLVFKVPISNFSRFKKQIKTVLKKFLQSGTISNKNLNINGEIVEAHWVTRVDDTRKALVGVIGVKKPIINIQKQTRLILDRIIRNKEKKLKKINNRIWSGDKWLGIINSYPLAEHENFSQELSTMSNNHCFSKIFMIEDNSAVFEIQKTMD